jgi:ribosomal protein S12 methylthiotransferase accessory factor
MDPQKTWANLTDDIICTGIVRVADLTQLDVIGLPVWQAVRPRSKNFSVSQGKGPTSCHAKISAVMEAIELWCAESPPLDEVGPADAIGSVLGYDPARLPLLPDREFRASQVIGWTNARFIRDQSCSLLPLQSIALDFTDRTLAHPCFLHTSTGLATGNTVDEAILHAIYEVIERDAISTFLSGQGTAFRLQLSSIDCSSSALILEACIRTGLKCEAFYIETAVGLPCVIAYLQEEGRSVLAFGSACHSDSYSALLRALSEAAQSRLTLISGLREDVVEADYISLIASSPNREIQDTARMDDLPRFDALTTAAELEFVSSLLADTGYHGIYADISRGRVSHPVVSVKIPGLRVPL